MADRLVTIATFGDVTQAHLARGVLEAAGIKAALTEEESFSVLGQTYQGLAGVHLLVREDDSERAGRVLDDAFDPAAVPEEELAAQAEAAGTQDEPAAQSPPVTPYDRESDAGAAFTTALIGLAFPPVWFYTAILILGAATGPGELSRRGRVYLLLAVTVVGGLLTLVAALLAALSSS